MFYLPGFLQVLYFCRKRRMKMSYSGFKLSVVLTLGFMLANSTVCLANGNITHGVDGKPAAAVNFDSAPGQDEKKAALLQSSLDSLTASGEVPGAVLCILLPGSTSISLSSGLADKEMKTPMQPSDRMFGGSTGKTFVAAIIMKLIREKKIRLDDKVSKYFGGQAWFSALPNASLITVKMLLNHTSGLPPYEYVPAVWDSLKASPGKIWTGAQRMAMLSGAKPVHEAGNGWSYSDSNYILLGMIIEKVTGLDYYDVLRREILIPYILSNTSPANTRDLPGMASGYSGLDSSFHLPQKVFQNGKYVFNPQMEWTGGGLVTTASDMALWARILYSGEYPTTDEVKQITTPSPFQTSIPGCDGYGYATIIWNLAGQPVYGHTGFVPGYLTIMLYIPGKDVAMALQVNTDHLPAGTGLFRLLEKFYYVLSR